MLDILTLRQLIQVLLWAALGTFPTFIAYGMGMEPEKKSEAERAIMFWLCTASQLGFGIAAYIAGAHN